MAKKKVVREYYPISKKAKPTSLEGQHCILATVSVGPDGSAELIKHEAMFEGEGITLLGYDDGVLQCPSERVKHWMDHIHLSRGHRLVGVFLM